MSLSKRVFSNHHFPLTPFQSYSGFAHWTVDSSLWSWVGSRKATSIYNLKGSAASPRRKQLVQKDTGEVQGEVGVRGDWEKRHLGEGLPRGQNSGKFSGLRGCSRNFCCASYTVALLDRLCRRCMYIFAFFSRFFWAEVLCLPKQQPRTARTESTQLYLPFTIISSTTQW